MTGIDEDDPLHILWISGRKHLRVEAAHGMADKEIRTADTCVHEQLM